MFDLILLKFVISIPLMAFQSFFFNFILIFFLLVLGRVKIWSKIKLKQLCIGSLVQRVMKIMTEVLTV